MYSFVILSADYPVPSWIKVESDEYQKNIQEIEGMFSLILGQSSNLQNNQSDLLQNPFYPSQMQGNAPVEFNPVGGAPYQSQMVPLSASVAPYEMERVMNQQGRMLQSQVQDPYYQGVLQRQEIEQMKREHFDKREKIRKIEETRRKLDSVAQLMQFEAIRKAMRTDFHQKSEEKRQWTQRRAKNESKETDQVP